MKSIMRENLGTKKNKKAHTHTTDFMIRYASEKSGAFRVCMVCSLVEAVAAAASAASAARLMKIIN